MRFIVFMLALAIAMPVQAEWSMVVLPDTQNYHLNPVVRLPYFYAQTQWAVDAADEFNIELVVGTGDITSENLEEEWITTVDVFSTLDGHLPYILPTGNHDYTPVRGNPWDEDRDSILMNDYFTSITHPAMIEKDPGKLENSYTRFTAPDGRKMLIFSLEAAPRADVFDWAADVAAMYPKDTVMLATHVNLEEGPADPNGEPTTRRDPKGQLLWDEWASKQENLELIVNGHDLDGSDTNPNGWAMTARQTSTGIHGNLVTEIGYNTQNSLPGGGDGWLRLYTFLDDGRTVHVRTYSPYLDSWITDDRNDFTFQLTLLADFNRDGTVDEMDLSEWEAGYGTLYDGTDFLTWQRNCGGNAALLASSVVSVPEPLGVVLGSLGILITVLWGRRSKK